MQEYNWRKEREKYQTDLANQPGQAPSGQTPPAQEPAAAPAAAKKSHAALWIAAVVCIAAAAAAVVVPPLLKPQSEAPKAAAEAAPSNNTETTVSANTEAAPARKPETDSANTEAEVEPNPDELPPVSPDTATMLADAAEQHKGAVGLVVLHIKLKSGKTGDEAIGTAWAFAPDKFATNAHVAEAFWNNYADLKKTLMEQFVEEAAEKAGKSSVNSYLKSLSESKQKKVLEECEKDAEDFIRDFSIYIAINGRNHIRYPVTHVQIHREWGVESEGGFLPDVAVLTIDGNLDTCFKIADRETLGALKSGTSVAYLGFPMERLEKDNVNVENPIASMQTGIIIAVSDFQFKDAGPSGNYWIRHNLPCTGGASGSPIFNRNGEVVALLNAGNIIDSIKRKYGRTPSAAMINFAVRVDLLDGVGSPVDIETFVKRK